MDPEDFEGAIPTAPSQPAAPARTTPTPPAPQTRGQGERTQSRQTPSSRGSGYSGNEWSSLRQQYIRAAGRTGNPDAFVAMLGEWRDMERYRVNQHLQSAMMASQMGNQMAAAEQLQAIGFYMSPGTRSVVRPGPNGSFAVRNYDADSDELRGGYALTPDQVGQMALAYNDIEGFMSWQTADAESQARTEQNWVRALAYQQTQQAQATLYDIQAQREAIAAGIAAATAQDRIRQQALATAQAEQNLMAGQLGMDGQVLANEIAAAELAGQEAAAADAASEELQERVSSVLERIEGISESTWGEGPQDGGLGGIPIGAAPEGMEMPTDPRAAGPLYRLNEQGNVEPDMAARELINRVSEMLLNENGDAPVERVATHVWRALFDMESNFEFMPAQEGEDGRPEGPAFVELDGVRYEMDPAEASTLQNILEGGREAMLRSYHQGATPEELQEYSVGMDEPITEDEFVDLFRFRNGQGFSGVAASNRLRAAREQAEETARAEAAETARREALPEQGPMPLTRQPAPEARPVRPGAAMAAAGEATLRPGPRPQAQGGALPEPAQAPAPPPTNSGPSPRGAAGTELSSLPPEMQDIAAAIIQAPDAGASGEAARQFMTIASQVGINQRDAQRALQQILLQRISARGRP